MATLLVTVLVVATLVGVGASAATAATAATATFTAGGSIDQVYTYGHAAGTTVQLFDPSNALVATGTADAQGAFLFRNLTPGVGYTVQANGVSSAPLTVTAPSDDPPDSWYAANAAANPLGAGYGYLTTRDGTKLAVNVTMPKNGSTGPWPVLIDYSGYDPAQPNQTPAEAQLYPYLGYVVVGINMRGTTCSGGAFWFFEDAQRTDGYDAVETLAHESWSNGNVGLVGISYSGYSQLYVASTQPPHLRAITPLSPFSDGYRGILYPGGILNSGFAESWALDRQADAQPAAHQWVKDRIAQGDTTCAQNQVMRLQSQDIASQIVDGRFDDPTYAYLDPKNFAPQINVPTFLSTQWQDEQTGGYGAELATLIAPHAYLRAWFTNGTHVDSLGPEDFLQVAAFVDLFVGKVIPTQETNALYRQALAQGLSSIFGTTIPTPTFSFPSFASYSDALAWYTSQKPIHIRWENGGVAGEEGEPYATTATNYSAWPIPGVTAQRWYLQPDGALTQTAPTVPDGQPRSYSTYTYDPTTKRTTDFDGSTDDMWTSHPDVHWLPDSEGNSLNFVSNPFPYKINYAGSGSADLWVRSSAADTDFEVTITDVHPDGHEVEIQSGWLRASRRALDTADSTVLRPVETFQAADAAPLPAGQFVPVRIELFPFAFIFRPGDRLRFNIEAPGGNQPFWAFSDLPGTATNDIAHSVTMPSSIALPLLNDPLVNYASPATDPSCSVAGVTTQSESLRNEPCRAYLPARIPTAVAAKPSAAQVSVSWTAPPAWPNTAPPTGYRITASPGGATVEAPAGATSALVSPGGAVGPFTFRVAAEFGSTVGPASDASAPLAVSTPSAVVAKPGDGTAVVSWKSPPYLGTPITGYVVTPYQGTTALAPQTFPSVATTETVTGLTDGSTLTFTVAATYATGIGGASASSAPLVIGSPSAPALLTAVPGNTQVTLKWWPPTPNGSAVTGYVITPIAAGVAQTPTTVSTTLNSQTITGLTDGVTYSFLVAAINARGVGPASLSAAVLVNPQAPAAPTGVLAKAGDGSADVAWKAPATDNGSAVTGYVVTPSLAGVAQPPVTFASTATRQTITGLTEGGSYTFTVAAVNAIGTGPSSAASPSVVVGVPAAPSLLQATAGNAQVVLRWWPPGANGSPVTGFVITPLVGGVAQAPVTFTSALNTQTVTGLVNGTTYTFRVAAVNARGTGASAVSPAATPTG